MKNKRLAVFCGSKEGKKPAYKQACLELAKAMATNNIDLVYGGGSIGLMGILADELLRLHGKVYGVIPEKLMRMEVGHMHISELYIVDTMHDRKAKMAEMADGFLALPGGIGTLEEIVEVFTWQQIGYHDKPVAFLNTAGYYDPLMTFIDQMVEQKFLGSQHRDQLITSTDPQSIIDQLIPEMNK